MEYLVQIGDGDEYGPVSQKELIEWAKDGRLDLDTKVRNKLFKEWKKAGEYQFLKEFLDKVENSVKKVDGGILKVTTVNVGARSLTFSGVFRFTPVGFMGRLFASIIDFVLVVAIWCLISIPTLILLDKKLLVDTPLVSTALVALFVFIFMLYQTSFLGMKASTPGYLFFGYILVRDTDGSEVLSFRAFCFSLFLFFFWWLVPLIMFVTPAKRTLHEFLVGCRVIHTRQRKRAKK
jgi:uncharacterized RDD family membrane protein YckC